MTDDEINAIVDGLAPVIKQYVQATTQRHERELATVREALITRCSEVEARVRELEARATVAETRVLELEARAATVRS